MGFIGSFDFSNLKCICRVSGLIVVRLHLLAMSGDAGGVLDDGTCWVVWLGLMAVICICWPCPRTVAHRLNKGVR